MDMNLSKLWEMVEDRGAWRTTAQGVTVRCDIVTEQHIHMDRHTPLFYTLKILHFLQTEGLQQP